MLKSIPVSFEVACFKAKGLKQVRGYAKISNSILYANMAEEAKSFYIFLAKLNKNTFVSEYYIRENYKTLNGNKISFAKIRQLKNFLIENFLLEIERINYHRFTFLWHLKNEKGEIFKSFNLAELEKNKGVKTPKKATLSDDKKMTTENTYIYKNNNNNINNNKNNINNNNNKLNKELEFINKFTQYNKGDFFADAKNPVLGGEKSESKNQAKANGLGLNAEFKSANKSQGTNEAYKASAYKQGFSYGDGYFISQFGVEKMRKKVEFKAPSLEEIKAEIRAFNEEHGSDISEFKAEIFMSYYKQDDGRWVMSNGKALKDWKRALRCTWLLKDLESEKRRAYEPKKWGKKNQLSERENDELMDFINEMYGVKNNDAIECEILN